jgi:hypothetical protein
MRKDLWFVMMPFGENFDEYFKEIYYPAITESNLSPRRADSIYRPSPILHDIWTFINDSNLIIADITGRNPNVMYELGLAHAVAKPVIIVSNNIEDVPFDLRAVRILIYNINSPKWANDLKDSIKSSIIEILESPIEAVLPTFLNVTLSKIEEVSEIKKDLIEIKQYLYRLDEEENENKSKIISAKEYGQAIRDAYRLYYDDGLDLTEIKSYLMSKFSIGISTASDIIDKARMKALE